MRFLGSHRGGGIMAPTIILAPDGSRLVKLGTQIPQRILYRYPKPFLQLTLLWKKSGANKPFLMKITYFGPILTIFIQNWAAPPEIKLFEKNLALPHAVP